MLVLNNAALKGQGGDAGRVDAVAHRGALCTEAPEKAPVNFQVSSNNEMHTVNVKQRQSRSNLPQLGNNGWLSVKNPTNS